MDLHENKQRNKEGRETIHTWVYFFEGWVSIGGGQNDGSVHERCLTPTLLHRIVPPKSALKKGYQFKSYVINISKTGDSSVIKKLENFGNYIYFHHIYDIIYSGRLFLV